jgi:hypothetical protein
MYICIYVSGIKSLLNMTPLFIIVSRLGNPFVSHLTIHKSICWVLLDSILPRQFSCRSYVQEKFNLNKSFIESTICNAQILTMSVFPESVLNHFVL